MSTGTKLVKGALQRIGAHSIAQPAAPETIEDTWEILNSMMQTWASWGIALNTTPMQVSGDDLHEPIDTTNAIKDNLAIMAASNFDNGVAVVSPQLKANARNGLNAVKTHYQTFAIPNKVPSSTLPKGVGNSKGTDRRVFFGTNEALSG